MSADLVKDARELAGRERRRAPDLVAMIDRLADALESTRRRSEGIFPTRRKNRGPLTQHQRAVFRVIERGIAENGYAPTLAELGEALGGKAEATISEHVGALERKGYIARHPNRPRGITILTEEG